LLRKLGTAPGPVLARRSATKLAAHRRELRTAWKAFRTAMGVKYASRMWPTTGRAAWI